MAKDKGFTIVHSAFGPFVETTIRHDTRKVWLKCEAISFIEDDADGFAIIGDAISTSGDEMEGVFTQANAEALRKALRGSELNATMKQWKER